MVKFNKILETVCGLYVYYAKSELWKIQRALGGGVVCRKTNHFFALEILIVWFRRKDIKQPTIHGHQTVIDMSPLNVLEFKGIEYIHAHIYIYISHPYIHLYIYIYPNMYTFFYYILPVYIINIWPIALQILIYLSHL